MDVGIAVAGGLRPGETVAIAQRAEELGLGSFWVAEGGAGDAFALLAAAATATSSIRLGTAVVSVFVRHLPLLGMGVLTLAHLAGGRFTLGIGPSHREQVEDEYGGAFARPLARVRDAVTVVRQLAAGDALSGATLSTTALRHFAVRMGDTPPDPFPILIGATGPRMIALAGEIADGIIPVWRTVDEIREIRRALPNGRRCALLLPCAVGASEEECVDMLAAARGRHARYHRYRELFATQTRGSGVTCVNQDRFADQLAAYAGAGLDEAILLPVPGAGRAIPDIAEDIMTSLSDVGMLTR